MDKTKVTVKFEELRKKVRKVYAEFYESGLEHFGFTVMIELSITSYRELCANDNWRVIRLEVDTPTEKVHRGTIYGTPFVLTQDTDRVLIAKAVE